ncbi:hypothetical protein F503_06355 [Ophiostoma piceae UAMH 11346]|uniref:DUF8004 domain-containing protein n=1 Tax=Ophiostoma piceae (strain UAMH 11346) TaxID=1262450 RepID=S3BZC6_OPHP1|nr:hypothetical protein F503_06355 [Ophiostoma piceae UAMH 11346]
MSGRSAYVRKKITETKANEKAAASSRGRARSTVSSDDAATISDYNQPMRQDTGIGTSNGRFLKFSEPIREAEPMSYAHMSYGGHSNGSSGGSTDGRREGQGPQNRPLDDFAYARARRPNIRTEDVSGIEKSGLRSAVDKKSEGVRRGLAKAFTFGKKNKKEEPLQEQRSPSVATVRPQPMGLDNGADYDAVNDPYDMAAAHHDQMQQHHMAMQERHRQQQLTQASLEVSSWDNGNLASPPPSAKLPPIPASNTPLIKRWIGAGRPVQRWNKLRKDPELWDPNGDVLVFFGQKGQQPRPNPSFRLSSHIIEATESRYLITLLREGSTEEDIQLPPSPIGAPPMLQRHMAGGGPNGHLGPHGHGRHGHGAYGMGQPTPPISEDASLADADGQISYEMYFPTPPSMGKVDQLRHHVTTRNIFALLYHASLVGLSLYQALSDLHARLEQYMPPEMDNVGTIINYLGARGIDDVRNDPENAISLLAWSESPEVRWEEGWRESFLHSTGMYASLEGCADFKSVTPITRALLERACLETQLRVQAAEERLAEFQYADMWPASLSMIANGSGPVLPSPAKAAADRMQKFLLAHYTHTYGRWPPLPPSPPVPGSSGLEEDEMWLTRTVAHALQKDFAALYDYLVDRDIIWDGSEARSGRKWILVSESGNRAFEADTPDLPMTDMLVEFDNKLRFPHIPHPFPLVPDSIPPTNNSSGKDKDKDKKKESAVGNRGGAVERRVQLAYTVATNMLILGSEFNQSDLIDAFSKFEKADRVGDVDPSIARRGRWVLVYGMLQTLASVSVDALNMRYRDNVAYHLSPRLKGAKMPPWRSMGGGGLVGSSDEAAHELSHCWLVPRTWNTSNTANNSAYEDSSATSSGGSDNNSPMRRNSIITGGSSSDRGGGSAYSFPRPPTNDGNSSRGGSGINFPPQYGRQTGRSGATMTAALSAVGGGNDNSSAYGGGSSYNYAPSSAYGGASSVMSSGSAAFSEHSSRAQSSRSKATSVGSRSTSSSKQSRPYGGASSNANSGINKGMSIGVPPSEEAEWAALEEQQQQQQQGRSNGRTARNGPPVLPGLAGIPDSQNNAFLMLDETTDESQNSNYTTEGDSNERRRRRRDKDTMGASREPREKSSSRRRADRPLLSQDADEMSGVAPVIRDFDLLDVIDDHEP